MARLELSIAFAANARTAPLTDGAVEVEGVDLVPSVLHPSEIFWRQLRFADFDISEMSMSSMMIAAARGDQRFVGLPVFTTRRFFHTGIVVRSAAGITQPADLKGKRVAVPEYQQTAALWTRGALQHEWGVMPADMEWWMERPPARSQGGATGFAPPAGVTVHTIPDDKNIGSMMVAGEVDAALHYIVGGNLVDRSTIDLWAHPDMQPLFADRRAEAIRYYGKTGLFPMNHGFVIRRDLAERHPWVVLNLFQAFVRALAVADRRRMEAIVDHVATGLIGAEAMAALQTPLYRHGVAANRDILATLAQYSHEQGLTPRLMTPADVFAESTLEL